VLNDALSAGNGRSTGGLQAGKPDTEKSLGNMA